MEVKNKKNREKRFSFTELKRDLKRGLPIGRENAFAEVCVAALGFLFGGCHVAFGAYPLGIALVCSLPSFVWSALLGVAAGALFIGPSGVVFLAASIFSVLIRIIISGMDRSRHTTLKTDADNIGDSEGFCTEASLENKESGNLLLFGEAVSLRACSAVIAGFAVAVYEIIGRGIEASSVLFGAGMIAFSGIAVLLLCGMFERKISIKDFLFGSGNFFPKSRDVQDRRADVRFLISVSSLLLFISLSLLKYSFFGIDLSYAFSSAVTLFAAKRFGWTFGAAAGFFSSVLVSGNYSLAFVLLGASAGALFSLAPIYATLIGGAVMGIWGAYSQGVMGFLSLFPEYAVGACLVSPLLRRVSSASERIEKNAEQSRSDSYRAAVDMVGTMALARRSEMPFAISGIEEALLESAPLVCDFCKCEIMSESYSIITKIISDARAVQLSDRELNEKMTDAAETVFLKYFKNGVARVFGERRACLICSGEDKTGCGMTSPVLFSDMESALGIKLSRPEFLRRGDMVVFSCESEPEFEILSARAVSSNSFGEISGDSEKIFESKDLFTYCLISDGMGSGEEAKAASEFSVGLLSALLGTGISYSTAVHTLNSIIRRNKEECGVTVDLFSFDRLTGEGCFIKSGAAPSYIKRRDSVFRIKSETMPLGFIKQVDAERIAVSISDGDYIIMISDGVCEVGEDAPWLIKELSNGCEDDLSSFAERILHAAKLNGKGKDDMTVIVMKVKAL